MQEEKERKEKKEEEKKEGKEKMKKIEEKEEKKEKDFEDFEDFNVKKESRVKKEVKKEKEKKDKKPIRKIIVRALLVLSLSFIAFSAIKITRNTIIMNDLKNKVRRYESSNNYFQRICNNEDNSLQKIDFYKKDNKSKLVFSTILKDGTSRKVVNFYNGEQHNIYIQSGKDKFAMLNCNDVVGTVDIINNFEFQDTWGLIAEAAVAKISSTNIDNKDCYKVEFNKDFIVYVDKETGLELREVNGLKSNERNAGTAIVSEHSYEFDNVKDDDLIEPDVTEYEVIEDNK